MKVFVQVLLSVHIVEQTLEKYFKWKSIAGKESRTGMTPGTQKSISSSDTNMHFQSHWRIHFERLSSESNTIKMRR